MFSCEYYKFFKDTYFEGHLGTADDSFKNFIVENQEFFELLTDLIIPGVY